MDDLTKQEKLADQYIQENNIPGAVAVLYDLIIKHAQKKNFIKSESLRDKLMQVDSMALDEIVKSGEIIEEEKAKSLDQTHMNLWAPLYNKLNDAESNMLYYSMSEASFDKDKVLFKQDQVNTSLYFVDQGQLKIVYQKDGTEHLIKTLGPGDLAGIETFFSISLCSTTLVTLSSVKTRILNTDVLEKWSQEVPSLEPKLLDHCMALGKISDLLANKGFSRRAHKRVKITVKANFQLLDNANNPIGKSFSGELTDISVGGLAFDVKSSQKKTVQMLLGRRIHIRFSLPESISQHNVIQQGRIIGANYLLFNDYSVSVKFDSPLNQGLINEIEQHSFK
jgi:CRP-like cAMP-binding protein